MLTHLINTSGIGTSEYSLPANGTTLTAQTELCVLEGWIRMASMAPGDLFEVTVYESLDGGSQLPFFRYRLDAAKPNLVLPAVVVKEGWNVTVKKLTGADRTAFWDLKKHTVALEETVDTISITTNPYSIPAATTTGVPTSQTADCLSQLWVSGAALAAGDLFAVRRYETINGGQILADEHLITIDTPTLVLPMVTLDVGWDVVLVKLAGTNRDFSFSHRRVLV